MVFYAVLKDLRLLIELPKFEKRGSQHAFMPLVFHSIFKNISLKNGGKHCGGRKSGTAWEKAVTFSRLLRGLQTNGRRVSQHVTDSTVITLH